MDKNNQDKELLSSDSGKLKEEKALVVRYIGAKAIEEIAKDEGKYIEAFAHTQLGIEKILWDRIVESFDTQRAHVVRQAIEDTREGKDKRHTTTFELIKWAHFLGAIDDTEYSDLTDFNKKRNGITHGHGQWWYSKDYKEALNKGIRFLRENGL